PGAFAAGNVDVAIVFGVAPDDVARARAIDVDQAHAIGVGGARGGVVDDVPIGPALAVYVEINVDFVEAHLDQVGQAVAVHVVQAQRGALNVRVVRARGHLD